MTPVSFSGALSAAQPAPPPGPESDVLVAAAQRFALSDPAHADSTLLESVLRRATLFVQQVGGEGLPTLHSETHTVVPVFSSVARLAEFVAATQEDAGEIEYVALPGQRFMDAYLPDGVGMMLDAGYPHQLLLPAKPKEGGDV